MTIIREARITRLAYLLTEQLRHGSEELRELAATCLLRLSEQAEPTEGVSAGRTAPEDLKFLLDSVQDAVGCYARHRRQEVLRAYALLLPRPTPQAMGYLSDPRHAALDAMAAQLRRPEGPVVRALLPMLAAPNLASFSIAGLRALNAQGRLGEGLEPIHLLQLPAVRRGLGKASTTAGLFPEAASIAAATPVQRRAMVAFVAALAEDPGARATRLLQLRKTPDAPARLLALRRLIELSLKTRDAGIHDAVAEFCDDADETIARTALRHLLRLNYAKLPKVLAALVVSRHTGLRRMAGQRLAPLAFERLWSGWPRLDRQKRLAAARAIIKIDPTFHRALGERLATGDRTTRLRALAIVSDLNQGDFYREALLRLAQSSDNYIASAAVRALGSASGDGVVKALEGALRHTDARVRANAVESLAALRSTQHVHHLVRMADDPQNRPRANAIAALLDLRTAEAVAALRRMLNDERPAHRASALWLIETVGLLELARHVAELSITDPDVSVKERAHHVVEGLMAMMAPDGEPDASGALAAAGGGGAA